MLTLEVLEALHSRAPEVWARAYVVGQWVWVGFDSKPGASARDTLKELGFRWNAKRGVWQNACGIPSRHSVGDPRAHYGMVPAVAVASNDDKGKAVA